jgi:hypothetical protein
MGEHRRFYRWRNEGNILRNENIRNRQAVPFDEALRLEQLGLFYQGILLCWACEPLKLIPCDQKGGYNSQYKVEHFDAKGRVADFLKAQPSIVSDGELSWTVVTSGPYMDMLNMVSDVRFSPCKTNI